MSEVFLKIVNMSISASWIVLAVLLLRLLLKKAPKWISVILWGIVAIRLICPFSIESVMSLIPSAETISPEIMMEANPSINTGIPIINNTINPIINNSFTPTPEASANPLQIWIPILSFVWITGIAILLAYTFISYWRVRRKVHTAVLLRDNVYQSEAVVSPFVLGVIKPKIYIPFNMGKQDEELVIAHEQAHIKRKDQWWKPLGFLILTLHWFNPLMWLGYVLLCRDIEIACDEKVVKELTNEQRADYSQALLTCSVNRRMIAACPLAFGEVGVKNRVKSVLNYKKPAFWIIVVSVIALIVTSVCLLTNPKTNDIKDLDDNLKVFLDMQVAEYNGSDESNDNFITVSYDLMKVDESGAKTTVYAWILYQEYSYENGILTTEAGSHIPTVITAKRNANNYELVEYWTPRDGSYWVDDIKAKFPMSLWSRATDSQRSIDKQTAECEKMAKEYFNLMGSYGITDSDIKVSSVGSDLSNVNIDVISISRNSDNQLIIKVRWNNNSDKIINYGNPFKIAKLESKKWVELKTDGYWVLPAYPVLPLSTEDTDFRDTNREREFNISAFYDIKDGETYKFSTEFCYDNDGTKKYNVWVEFSYISQHLSRG